MNTLSLAPSQIARLKQMQGKYGPEHPNHKPLKFAEFLLMEGDYVIHPTEIALWPGRSQEITVASGGTGHCTCGETESCAHRMMAWILADPDGLKAPAPAGQKPSLQTLYQRFRQASATAPQSRIDKTEQNYFPWQVVQDAVEHITGGHWGSTVSHRGCADGQAFVTVGITIHCVEGDVYREAQGVNEMHPKNRKGESIAKSEENAFLKAERRAFKRAASLYGFRLPDDD